MSKIFYFDLETTGVDHKLHGIHQISAAAQRIKTLQEEIKTKPAKKSKKKK